MNRCVNDVEIGLALDNVWINGIRLDALDIGSINLFVNQVNFLWNAFKLDIVNRGNFIHLGDDGFVVRGYYLSTVVPIHFVTVILWWVVRSRYDDTTLATQLANGKRELWRWAKSAKQIHFYAIG